MRLPQILSRSGTRNTAEVDEETDILNLIQGNERGSSSFFNPRGEDHVNLSTHLDDSSQFFDEHGNKITRAQAVRADRFEDLDRQAEIVGSLIKVDKNYKYLVILEKEEQRRRGGISQFIKQQIADFLVPPAMRPEYEREREEMRKEQMALKRKGSVFRAESQMKGIDPVNPKGVTRDPQAVKQTRGRPVILAHRSEKLNAGLAKRFDMLDHYRGDRFQGARHGMGTQIFENGDKFEGQWVGGIQEGFGCIIFRSNDKYEGQWHFGRQHGLGIFTSSSGGTYRGNWRSGLRDGYGETCDRFGRISFRGEWRDGRRHGCGIKVKPGIAFMGEWLEDKKHGEGILRSDVAAIGIGRFFTRWERGRLVLRVPYDNLLHGMDVINAAMWASRYAAAEGDAALAVVRMRIAYPARPDERAREGKEARGNHDDDTHALNHDHDSEMPEHVVRFRETWITSRSALESKSLLVDQESWVHCGTDLDRTERELEPAISVPAAALRQDLAHAASSLDRPAAGSESARIPSSGDQANAAAVQHRVRIPARELRRLISLVHSADKKVEELVLPILDDAFLEADCIPGEEVFDIGPVWDNNIELLKIHFAIKIQRKWRSLSWRRAFKAAKVAIQDEKEMEVMAKTIKQQALQSDYERQRQLDEQDLVERVQSQSLNSKLSALKDEVGCSPIILNLMKRSRKLFGLEMQIGSVEESCDRWLLFDDEMVGTVKTTKSGKSGAVNERQHALGFPQWFPSSDEDVNVTIGKYLADNGVVYYGQIAKQLPHGFGTARYPDGTMYAGQFSFGQRHGVGEYVRQLEDRDRHFECSYMGEWQENQRHGFAIEQKKAVGFVDELLSSTLVEYKEDKLVSCEAANEETCAEWLAQCKEVSMWARRAADEAQAMSHEKKVSRQSNLKLSKLIEFSLNQGFSLYCGSFDSEGRKNGPGMLELETGRRLAGDWINDVFEGFGREDLSDGSFYVGQFRDGKRHGLGRFEHVEDNIVSTYLGEWNEGTRHGRGIERRERKHGLLVELEWVAVVEYSADVVVNFESFNSAKIATFVDQLELAVRNGARSAGRAFPAVRENYEDSKSAEMWYVGGKMDGVRAGSGVLAMRDGSKYIGDFHDGAPDGYGVETYPDGSVYTGQFKASLRDGFGKYTTARGMYHIGEWSKGLREGRAIQRSVIKLASGSIARDYHLEFAGDQEISRMLVRTRELAWLKLAENAVKQAEESSAVTVRIYENLLD